MPAVYIYDNGANLAPATICQLFYVLGAAAVLAIAATPDSAQRLLTQYGARSSPGNSSAPASSQVRKNVIIEDNNTNTGLFVRLVTWVTSVGKVPHSWFIHFYFLSLTCTIFWAVQFLTHGTVLELIVSNQAAASPSSMTIGQVVLVWSLMGLQGARRLYECLTVLRPSASRMWIVHWLLGNAFYFCTSISIWVEGSRSIWHSDRDILNSKVPSLKSMTATSVFLIAWFMQYQCHQHLSRLKKYSFPDDGLFRYLVCPHYTCECVLYLSMAVAAAPDGQIYNQTLACAVLFISTNLGVTANGTKRWYSDKFGSRVQGKWKMIPFVF
ncbi:3-oxo-5-alpha-steroid 4-dehydrogenase [Xylariaceae sp. FL1651]|nr:3-oxo-5-alpha-steroid 4-dehydrogenase [Xylariaceae sp. FL1651]